MKFSIEFSKELSKNTKTQTLLLECSVNYFHNSEYITCKSKLDILQEEKANSFGIRSKCDRYEYHKKSTKFFLNLKSSRARQSKIRKFIEKRKGHNRPERS